MVDVARHLAIPVSSTAALLETLATSNAIRTNADGSYRLGTMVLRWASAVDDQLDLAAEAEASLTTLATSAGGTANLAVLDGRDVVYLAKVEDPSSHLLLRTRVGGGLPAHATALGKVLLASQSRLEREKWLAQQPLLAVTHKTITSRKTFREHLKACDERGWALDDEESHLGVRCIAAPIRNHQDVVIAAISVSIVKLGSGAGDPIPPSQLVLAAAHELETRLGRSLEHSI